MRIVRWARMKAIMNLPGCRRRALDRIGQALVAEDPRLGSRFGVFARLTVHEAMPGTEQVPGRLQRFLRPAMMLPLTVISLVALLAASWLIPSGPACRADAGAAAHRTPQVSREAGCQPGPAVKPDRVRMH